MLVQPIQSSGAGPSPAHIEAGKAQCDMVVLRHGIACRRFEIVVRIP